MENGSVDAKLDRLVHSLVGSIKRRVIALEQDKGEVAPSLSAARVEVVHDAEHLLSLSELTKVVASDTKPEMSKGSLEILRAHQEHDLSIFPSVKFGVAMACTLEEELIFDVLTAQIGNSDSAHVVLQRLFKVILEVQRVTDLDVALEPRILQVNHLL